MRRFVQIGCLAFYLLLWPKVAAAAGGEGTSGGDLLRLLGYLVAWFLPLGLALLTVGLSKPSRATEVATAFWLAVVAAVAGYYLCGYAFQFGGIGLVSADPALADLVAEWSPLDLRLGPGWGVLGLRGFLPALAEGTGEGGWLLLSQLPLVTTAVLLPLVTLNRRLPQLPRFLLALLVACVIYPLWGNWVRGGGWLANLGLTLGLGQGVVDYGLSGVYLLGAAAALAGLVSFRHYRSTALSPVPELPPAYLPLNALLGAILALVGWLAILLGQPLVLQPADGAGLVIKALLLVAAALLGALFYGWLAKGEPDLGLASRSVVAAMAAGGAGLPFLPLGVLLALGALVGLFLAPAMYGVERGLKLEDEGAVLSALGLPALVGLLAVGLFADGCFGVGGNAAAGGLVRGYFAAAGPGQLYAQWIGVGAILILAWGLPWVLLTIVARAYVLPGAMRRRAILRAEQLRRKRDAEERLRRQGGGLRVGQRIWMALLRREAAPALALRRRPRRPRVAA